MKQKQQYSLPQTTHDAYSVVAELGQKFENKHPISAEDQIVLGEILRTSAISESVKLQAVTVISNVIIDNPADAQPTTARRLAKFIQHGTEQTSFVDFDPSSVMGHGVNALIAYTAEQYLDPEMQGILLAAAHKAPQHGVPEKKAQKLMKAILD
jgi:hypothetical protein